MKPGKTNIRVLLAADGHSAQLRERLDELEDIEVVGEAGDDEEAVRLAYSLQPDVVFVDISVLGLGELARAMCSDSA